MSGPACRLADRAGVGKGAPSLVPHTGRDGQGKPAESHALCLQTCDRAAGEQPLPTAGWAMSPARKLHPRAQGDPQEGGETPEPVREGIGGAAAVQDPAGDAIGASTATSPPQAPGDRELAAPGDQGSQQKPPPASLPVAPFPASRSRLRSLPGARGA